MKLWMARDKQGYLGLYYEKPIYTQGIYSQREDWHGGGFLRYLDDEEFPEVTFENSPMQVELKLVK